MLLSHALISKVCDPEKMWSREAAVNRTRGEGMKSRGSRTRAQHGVLLPFLLRRLCPSENLRGDQKGLTDGENSARLVDVKGVQELGVVLGRVGGREFLGD